MVPISLDVVRAHVHRLFIGDARASLRREDEQKCRELAALLPFLARLRKGAHVVDAAAGKASVGLLAAELLPIGRLTILERDPARVQACRAAVARLERSVEVDIRHADVADLAAWPEAADAVVALHACGGAADSVIAASIASRARQLFLAPCCYGVSVPFRAQASALIGKLDLATDDAIVRRLVASLVDIERQLVLEAAGYQTEVVEFVAPTTTPHNLLFRARAAASETRVARAGARRKVLKRLGEDL